MTKRNCNNLLLYYSYIKQRMSSTKQDLPSGRQKKSNVKKRLNTQNRGTKMVQSGINTQIVYRNINSHSKGMDSRSKRSQSSSHTKKINEFRRQNDITKIGRRQRSFTLENQKQVSKISDTKKIYTTEQQSLENEPMQNQASTDTIQLKERDQKLQKLRDRNKVLKDQIYRIQKLEQERTNQSLQKKQHSFQQIYYATSTKQSLQQQLSNAYFKIKQMEVQMQELRKIEALDQPKKVAKLKARIAEVEKIKHERTVKLDKLRRQNKKTQEKIEECRQGGGYAETVKQLIIEVDELREKHSEVSLQEQKRKQKILKQQQYIRKLQKQLTQNGTSTEFIQQLMNKIVYGVDRAKNKIPQKIDILPVLKKPSRQQTIKQYQKIQHQIGILAKSVKEQEKMLEEASCQQKSANIRCQKAQFQSGQLDQEIQQLQRQIGETRKSINPDNLKPKPLPPKQPSLEMQKNQQKQHIRQMRKRFHEKKTKKYLQGLQNLDQQNEFNEVKQESKLQIKQEINEDNKCGQQIKQGQEVDGGDKKYGSVQDDWQKETDVQVFGNYDGRGVRFSDKEVCTKIGFQQCKITGFSVLLQSNNSIQGIRAQYNHTHQPQFHKTPRPIQSELQQQFSCVDDEYITSISGTFSQTNLLLNLTVLTSLNRYHRFGSVLSSRGKGSNQFDICSDGNSRPVYILGSANETGICQFGAKVLREESQSSGEEDT